MTDELQIWALDSAGEATPVKPTDRTQTEALLEGTLVRNPDMLMPDLSLVGRQTPLAGGYLDLLGVDAEGALVVFELKKGTLTRDAVAQVIDYGSCLESLDDDDLVNLIMQHSGKGGVDAIENFEEWYGASLESLRPVRMALVGLGVDDNAARMVNYLQDQGVSIELMTFYGYQLDGQTLLARHMDSKAERDVDTPATSTNRTFEEYVDALQQHASSLGIEPLWLEAYEELGPPSRHIISPTPRSKGVTFYHQNSLHMEELVSAASVQASHSIRIAPSGKIRVTFFPVAIELCYDEFMEERVSIPFRSGPSLAPKTERAPEQWYCLLDADEWAEHKEALVRLVKSVDAAWNERLNSDPEE